MRILYVGNYRHPWCTEVHLARELGHLGHEVVCYQEPPGGGNLGTVDAIEHAVEAHRPDLVMWTRTWSLPRAATDLWRRLERRGIVTASYHLDRYRDLARAVKMPEDPFWSTGFCFTPDGDDEAQAWFAAQGINHHWMPPAVVSDECIPGTFSKQFDHDVVFVGSAAYHDEWEHRQKLLAWLAENYGDRFRRYGGDTVPGPIRGQDLSDLYASAKVVVGDSCFASRTTRYVSDRPFETWGRGGYLIFPRIDWLTEQVGPYPSWDPGDWDALRDRIESALGDAYHRDGTVARLQGIVRERHTYKVRLGQALAIMGFGADERITRVW